MITTRSVFVGLSFVFAVGCGSSGRLTDSEIDRACALATDCSGTGVSACTRATVDARAIADNNGCADIFARTNRCYLSDLSSGMCTLSARCQVLTDELTACSTTPRDAGVGDGGGGGRDVGVSPSDWVTALNESEIASQAPVCDECPALFEPETCESPGFTPTEQSCMRAAGNRFPQIPSYFACITPYRNTFVECLLRASRTTCPPDDTTSCENAYTAGARTCPTPSEDAASAYNGCFP